MFGLGMPELLIVGGMFLTLYFGFRLAAGGVPSVMQSIDEVSFDSLPVILAFGFVCAVFLWTVVSPTLFEFAVLLGLMTLVALVLLGPGSGK